MKFQEQKRIQAIVYFALKSPGNNINRLKLMKLLWLSDRIHLNRYGRMILDDEYCALPNGPVPSKTMDVSEEGVEDIFSVNNYNIKAEDQFNLRFFSKSDRDVLQEVWDRFGGMSDIVLRYYSHFFPEWKRFEKELNDTSCSKTYRMRIDDFFKEPSIDAKFEVDLERSEISRSIYYENNKIQEIL